MRELVCILQKQSLPCPGVPLSQGWSLALVYSTFGWDSEVYPLSQGWCPIPPSELRSFEHL